MLICQFLKKKVQSKVSVLNMNDKFVKREYKKKKKRKKICQFVNFSKKKSSLKSTVSVLNMNDKFVKIEYKKIFFLSICQFLEKKVQSML